MAQARGVAGLTRRFSFVVDCSDRSRLRDFWTQALGYVCAWEGDPYTVLVPDGEPGPAFLLQQVNEPKSGKNRCHIDLHVADPAAEAERLVALGATRAPEIEENGFRWIVMSDPEGNEFCLVQLRDG